MTAKEKSIQEAYQGQWETVSHYVDEDGWLDTYIYRVSTSIPCELHSSGGAERPLTLSGIENNNGWIRCDERLPDDSNETILFCENGIPAGAEHWKRGWEFRIMVRRHGLDVFTHWRPVEEVKPPIY